MHRWIPAILLIALLSVFRVIGSAFPTAFPNGQPLLALVLCSFVFLEGRQRWIIPLAVWLLTDPISSMLQNHPILGWHHLALALGIAVTIGIASVVRRKPTLLATVGGTMLSAVAFYILTNLVSFLSDPLYAKTLSGFVQAQWSGPVGYEPTWVFFRNSICSNAAFAALFMASRASLPSLVSAPSQIVSR